MKKVLEELTQKQEELTLQLKEIENCRKSLQVIFGQPKARQLVGVPTISGLPARVPVVEDPTPADTIQRPNSDDPNLNAAFDSIIPVLQASNGVGCTFKQLHRKVKPIRPSIKQYKKVTIHGYLSSLRTNGFIRKTGKKYFIIK